MHILYDGFKYVMSCDFPLVSHDPHTLVNSYFIFTSFWQYKIYYVFGFMLLVFLIMMVVTVCVTIVCTYFLLNSEDYRWYGCLGHSCLYLFS